MDCSALAASRISGVREVLAASRLATTVISQARGLKGWKINRGVESPDRYVLQIFWETLENHTVDFRQSPEFQQWRAIVGGLAFLGARQSNQASKR